MLFFYDCWQVWWGKIRIRKSKMKRIWTDPDPQHWLRVHKNFSKVDLELETGAEKKIKNEGADNTMKNGGMP